MTYKPYVTILEVKWCDAKSWAEWLSLTEQKKAMEDGEDCYSIGYFVGKTKMHLCLTSTYTDDNDAKDGGLTKIPLGCILKVREVKRERVKRRKRK